MTQKEQLEQFLKVLEDYAKTKQYKNINPDDEVDCILSSTEQERQSWNDITLSNKAFTLQKYGAYLQKSINQEKIKQNWAKSNLRVLYGKESTKYDRWSYEERKDAILADNEACMALNEILLNAESRITQIEYISTYMSSMSDTLLNMSKDRRSERYAR